MSWRQAVATPLRKCGSSNCWAGEWGGWLVRLERAVHLQAAQPDLDLLGVALHLGYHDYQHLVRDCRPFAGITPPRLGAGQRHRARAAVGTDLDKMSIFYH